MSDDNQTTKSLFPTVTEKDRYMAQSWWRDYQGGPAVGGSPFAGIYGADRKASFEEQLASLVAAAREGANRA